MINEQTNTCDGKAEYIVPWAGELKKCCAEHAHQLQHIGEAIGMAVSAEPIKTEEKCYRAK